LRLRQTTAWRPIQSPYPKKTFVRYRTVAAADSSRNLPPRTSGILSGQDVLTVPDMQSKLAAQMAGLGVGYLPENLAKLGVQQNLLVIKQVLESKPLAPSFLAWHQHQKSSMGKSQQWLLKRLEKLTLNQLLL